MLRKIVKQTMIPAGKNTCIPDFAEMMNVAIIPMPIVAENIKRGTAIRNPNRFFRHSNAEVMIIPGNTKARSNT